MMNVLDQSSAEVQAFSAYKQMKNPKKISRCFVSKSSGNMHIHRGVLLAPPPPLPSRSFSYSYPPSFAHQSYTNIQPQQQTSPPLLPLPVPKPRHNSLPSPPSRRPTRPRDKSLTPKKSKQPTRRDEPIRIKQDFTKPAQKKIAKQQEAVLSESLIFATLNPLGPDPNDLPKDVSKVFGAGIVAVNNNNQDFEKFSGSVFTVSPPPSSLPLPKFSMRPKQLMISCNADAAGGINAGATDNLRRLLRLR